MATKRRDELLAYLKHRQERELPNHFGHCKEDECDQSYGYSHWTEELIQGEYIYKEAVYQALGYGKEADKYLIENPSSNKKLEDRELAIKEWYEDHGLNPDVDTNPENREDYIWWYEKNDTGASFRLNEKKKRNDIMVELTRINKRKQELEKELRPWIN